MFRWKEMLKETSGFLYFNRRTATDHWVSFGLNQLNLFGMSINMKVVDQMNAHGMWRSQELTDQTVADAKHMGPGLLKHIPKEQ